METNQVKLENANGMIPKVVVDKYEGLYAEHIDIASQALKDKFEYHWTPNDTIAFGAYADNWEGFREILESDNTSRNTLGPALDVNLGLITMSFSAMPIQHLASIQPLNDEAGTVFFRQGVATTTRGMINTGDTLINHVGQVNGNIAGYMNETQTVTQNFGASITAENVIQTGKEVRPGSVKIVVGNVKAMDDGEGHILGVGVNAEKSTINYLTGEVKLVLVEGTSTSGIQANTTKIDVTYSQSLIDSNEIPTMKWVLNSKVVRAEYSLLQSQYSNLSELVLRKRFGAELSTQVAADLITQAAAGVLFQAIHKLRTSALRVEQVAGESLTWTKAAAGISEVDHRRTFEDKLIEAVGVMYKIAGKGEVSALIVGTEGKKILKSCGMRSIKAAVSGPHMCGMMDNVPVFYAPQTALGSNEILVVYRGSNWYESQLVYAPFLPVTTVTANATTNLFTSGTGVFHAAAMESVLDGFCVRIQLQ